MAIIGIDLGTTNSLVSYWNGEKVQLIPNSLGSTLTPSVINVDAEGTILVGESARNRLITHPQESASFFKRDMGSGKVFTLGNRNFLPEELSSLVLRSLKEDAEVFLGEKVEEAVISVPAYFNDTQRKATRNAGILAGLKVERLVNEPTAAAIAYGLHERFGDGMFLVLDLGGGTFDVSLLEFTDGIMEVHAVAGDNRLGGEDFTEVLVQFFLDQHSFSLSSLTEKEREILYRQAEKCKFALSEKESSTISVTLGKAVSGTARKRDLTITREEFTHAAAPLLEKLYRPIERTIRDARVDTGEIDELVLVGGATRMAIFRDMIYKIFKRIPSLSLNPDEIVGMGAGIQGGLKARDKALEDVILTDICPYTLGTAVMDVQGEMRRPGMFLPIINRNSTVPVSRMERLGTVKDNQKQMKIEVYQGEHRQVKDNIRLGTISVDIPSAPAGRIAVEVRYTYDINGLLEVEVHIPETGERKSLIIEENPGVLSREELEKQLKKLEALKIHPRETGKNKALIARGERLWEEYLGEERTKIGKVLGQFESLLEKQDAEEIALFSGEMEKYFDYLEKGV